MNVRLMSRMIASALALTLPVAAGAFDMSAFEKAQKAAAATKAVTAVHVPAPAPSIPAQRTFTPPPSAPSVGHNNGYVPANTARSAPSGTTYAPRAATGSATSTGATPGTTYTPHASGNTSTATTYTPHASGNASTAATTYTPHASGNASTATTYTPHASGNAATATTYTPHANATATTYTPHANSSAEGVTTYTPHASTNAAAEVTTHTSHAVTQPAQPSTYTPHVASNTASTASLHPTAAATSGGETASERKAHTVVSVNTERPTIKPSVTQPAMSKATTTAPAQLAYAKPAADAIAVKSTGGAVLTHAASASVIGQVNTTRAGMKGINAAALPTGTVTTHANGSLSVSTNKGDHFGVRANGTLASYKGSGVTASFNGNGHVAALHTATMDIRQGPNSQRTIVSHMANHSTLVSTGKHSGYLERPVEYGGHSFIQRSYVAGNRHFVQILAPYRLHGLALAAYVATPVLAPGYYGWAAAPWGGPVPYAWGWAGASWYNYYNNYFAPALAYAAAADWLTDYAVADTLEDAYDDQDPGAVADAGDTFGDEGTQNELAATEVTPITPELRQAIAQEVQEQIAEEQAAAAAPAEQSSAGSQNAPVTVYVPSAPVHQATAKLEKSLHADRVFVVASSLDATTADQQTCGLTPGDVLQMKAAPAEDDPFATVRVASSKRADCPAGTLVQLSLQDLQDMQNSLHARVDSGLLALREAQGKKGLPAAPQDALAAANLPTGAATPDASVQALLDAQQQQANLAEAQVTHGAFYD